MNLLLFIQTRLGEAELDRSVLSACLVLLDVIGLTYEQDQKGLLMEIKDYRTKV